jgi:hypothetical protein
MSTNRANATTSGAISCKHELRVRKTLHRTASIPTHTFNLTLGNAQSVRIHRCKAVLRVRITTFSKLFKFLKGCLVIVILIRRVCVA